MFSSTSHGSSVHGSAFFTASRIGGIAASVKTRERSSAIAYSESNAVTGRWRYDALTLHRRGVAR